MAHYRILNITSGVDKTIVLPALKLTSQCSIPSFQTQLDCYIQNRFYYAHAYSKEFETLGHDSVVVIPDFEVAQKQWAKEHGLKYVDENWIADILFAQIVAIKPDIVFFHGTFWTRPGLFASDGSQDNLIQILKSQFTFIKRIAIFSGYPSEADRIRGADIFFSSPPGVLENYKTKGLKPYLLYHAFDSSVTQSLNRGDLSQQNFPFTFIGSVRAPEARYFAIRRLLDHTNLQAWTNEPAEHKHKRIGKTDSPLKEQFSVALRKTVNPLHEYTLFHLTRSRFVPNVIKKRVLEEVLHEKCSTSRGAPSLCDLYTGSIHLPVYGLELYNLLRSSLVTFNLHADVSYGSVGNLRMFEATGMGACLLTDSGNNMNDLFTPDHEVVTYQSIDEAIEKIAFLLENPEKAKMIADSGRARTLKDHTVSKRCLQIDEIFQKSL